MATQIKVFLTLLFLSITSFEIHSSVIHKERSLYSNVIVKRIGPNTCLQFNVRRDTKNQSCFNPQTPKKLVFSYAKMTMASILFVPEPKNILIIGLGGGTLPMAFHRLFNQATIHAVEIDTAVVKVAKKYFDLIENDQIKVFSQDGRVYTKRAKAKSLKYDLIILDAFNGDYIPEHLMTREYLQENQSILSKNGLLASNTFSTSALYHHESETYASVFNNLVNFKRVETNNRVLFAPVNKPDQTTIMKRAKKFKGHMTEFDVPIMEYAKDISEALSARPDWNQNARILTDQYSPANLLRSN